MNQSTDEPVVRDVDSYEVIALVGAGALLVDVREPDEAEAGHIDGALHLLLGDLDVSAGSTNVPVVALCRSGNRSSKAAAALATSGHDVVNLAGGMQAWAQQGHPVATDHATPGSVK